MAWGEKTNAAMLQRRVRLNISGDTNVYASWRRYVAYLNRFKAALKRFNYSTARGCFLTEIHEATTLLIVLNRGLNSDVTTSAIFLASTTPLFCAQINIQSTEFRLLSHAP